MKCQYICLPVGCCFSASIPRYVEEYNIHTTHFHIQQRFPVRTVRYGPRILDFFFTCRPQLPYRAKFSVNQNECDTNGHCRGVSRSFPPFYLLWKTPKFLMNQANPISDSPAPFSAELSLTP